MLQWNRPPDDLSMAENEVHIWRAALDLSAHVLDDMRRLLAQDEIERAERFYFEKDRNHFIMARGILRTLLGRYLHIDPAHLRFGYNAYGKPFVDLPANEPHTLNFNLSHSRGLALYTFAYSRQVGIDVEYMRSVDYEQIAQHFFSPYEHATLCSLPAAARREAFFHCWTRKEAYIKARGEGLSIPLAVFDVSLRPGEPAALLSCRQDPQEPARWSLQALAPAALYAGAIAIEGRGWHGCYWNWQA